MKKYLRTCWHCARCARCARCMFSHAGVLCRNYKSAGDDIIIDKAFVDDAPDHALLGERVDPIVPDDYGDYDSFIAALLADDNNFYVLSFWGANTNGFYDPDLSYNGGGYWQPSGGCLIAVSGRLVVVEYDKYDCGDFGCRRDYVVETPGFRWQWRESNLDGEGYDDTLSLYQSISGAFGVDADWFLGIARDAVQFAASATWDSRDYGAESAV